MTMVPAHSLSKQQQRRNLFHHGGVYGGGNCGGGGGYEYNSSSTNCVVVGSDSVFPLAKDSSSSMAEDESRTNSINDGGGATAAAAPSYSNGDQENQEQEIREDEGWLRLSIGGNTDFSNTPAAIRLINDERKNSIDLDLDDPTVVNRRGGLVELDLLPPGTSSPHTPVFHVPPRPMAASAGVSGSGSFVTSLFFHQQQQQQQQQLLVQQQHEAINWGFRPVLQMQYHHHHHPNSHNIASGAAASSSSPNSQSSSSPFLPLGSYLGRTTTTPNFHLGIIDTGAVAGPSSAGPITDFRLIDPPRRPFSGIWFTLLASRNQTQEPFLPQISKSYLRIKDGRMTVRLLMKYLVNKLRLDSESEVEITCRGQQLQPYLTLQHVRDNVWSPTERYDPLITLQLTHSSSTIDHVMVLHYSRTPPPLK